MPTRFVFDFAGDYQVDRTLTSMANRAQDSRPAWQALATRFQVAETKQFATEGDYGSTRWAPLSPRYKRWKDEHYPGKPILERTGKLLASLTQRPFGVEDLAPSYMRIGTDVFYAKFHQRGTIRMPRRAPVELPESERKEWVRILQRWIQTGTVS